jgi:LysM repeat protein
VYEFVATEPEMRVFVELWTKWGLDNNGFFLDSLGLYPQEMEHTPTPTPLPPPPTATPGPSPTPLPTPTPRPDGAIVHIVEPGDTLFGIAYTYDVPVDQLRELNAGSLGPNDLLSVGQAVVISVPENAPTPTPLPQTPTATPGVQPTASPEPEGESDPGEGSEGGEGSGGAEGGNSEGGAGGNPGGAYICVASFHDRNGDTFRDPETEELLPNTEFKIANASGVVEQYTTDGVSEPYCFNELEPGSYRVIQSAPPGYEPNGLPEQNVALAEGTGFEFQFGNVRSEEANNPSESDEPASPENENGNENNGANGGSTFGRVLSTAAKVAGVLVLMLAAAIAVLFVLSRRQRY